MAIGYVRKGLDQIEKDPDLRVQDALALIFRKFAELQSARQVLLWVLQEKIVLPAVRHGLEGRRLEWKAPVYNTIHHILCNPIYAGAYAYGRSASKTRIANGRKQIVRGFRVVERAADRVRVADPARAAWYAEQGLLTICPTRHAIDQAEQVVLAP